MADCELLQRCPFYNDEMKKTDGLGALYRQRYCVGDNSTCARYMVFRTLGRSAVPEDLYPNMVQRANEIRHPSGPQPSEIIEPNLRVVLVALLKSREEMPRQNRFVIAPRQPGGAQ